MNISVIGLGKLGAVKAAVLADSGHNVIGVDIDSDRVALINEGRAPVIETGLDELIRKNRARLRATTDCEEAIRNTEITFIVVPTPSTVDGTFSLLRVSQAANLIGDALRKKTKFHLVVLSSTVMPGATRDKVLPTLEQRSGKKCGVDFGLCYNPEFIALGSVIHDMRKPDMILIGESDQRSGLILESVYEGICNGQPSITHMNFINAELIKLAVNTFVTTKISYANMLAEVCERLPNADVDVVTSALGLDSRIGSKYLKGALGYGGPCFPRDNAAFSALAWDIGALPALAETTDYINQQQAIRIGRLVMQEIGDNGIVGILGLAYKPDTNVTDESQGVALANYLIQRGVQVNVYDPAVTEIANKKVRFTSSAEECITQSEVVVIATPWNQFKKLKPRDFSGKITIDCWRLLDHKKFDSACKYIAIGRGKHD